VLAEAIVKSETDDLVAILASVPSWRYPRHDLNAWVDVLDKLDEVLAEVITSYDIAKIQVNPFTPKTKELVLQILRFQKLLLENCTSRKLFASYDVSPTRETSFDISAYQIFSLPTTHKYSN
jgi:E3 ubiquitin-protein ligase HUWE1